VSIVGFFNPTTGRYHGLDDLEGIARVMEPAVLRDMVQREAADEAHRGTSLTVTAALGCPRKLAIQRFLPTRPDPLKMWAALAGTYLHEKFAELKKLDKGWTTEFNGGKAKCTFKGRLFGYDMTCRVDAFHVDETGRVDVIRDYKTSMSGADKYVDARGAAKPEHAAQLNMCRLLMIQDGVQISPNVVMEARVIGGGWAWSVAPLLDELAIGLTPVGVTKIPGRVWSARELLDQVARLFAAIEAGRAPKLVIAEMPLVGLDMYKTKKWGTKDAQENNMCSAYCAVRRECDGLDGRGL